MAKKTNYLNCGLLLLAIAFPGACKGGNTAQSPPKAPDAATAVSSPAKANPNTVDCSKPEPAVPRCPPELSASCARAWAPALAWRAKCKKK
jgi:hypothetical protein